MTSSRHMHITPSEVVIFRPKRQGSRHCSWPGISGYWLHLSLQGSCVYVNIFVCVSPHLFHQQLFLAVLHPPPPPCTRLIFAYIRHPDGVLKKFCRTPDWFFTVAVNSGRTLPPPKKKFFSIGHPEGFLKKHLTDVIQKRFRGVGSTPWFSQSISLFINPILRVFSEIAGFGLKFLTKT